jgi:hypothetical protein
MLLASLFYLDRIIVRQEGSAHTKRENWNFGEERIRMSEQSDNLELKQLGTHQAGAVNLHQTRTASQTHSIGKPVSAPGAKDSRQSESGE